MQKVRSLICYDQKVVRDGLALIFNSSQNIEVVGREGADVIDEAFRLQPDLLVHELNTISESEFELLRKLKNLCGWTKIIVLTSQPLTKECLISLLGICDGCLQGPVLPGFLLKAIDLACFSGHFFFLGSSKKMIQ